MCEYLPVSEVVKLPINWVRGNDDRLKTIFRSLTDGDGFKEPIKITNCGCGKSYMLEDGGHRITAAYELFRKTGQDIQVRIHRFKADFQ